MVPNAAHEDEDEGGGDDDEDREHEQQPQRFVGGGVQLDGHARPGEDEEEAEQDQLDDGARERVDRARGDRRRGRDPLPLEEADVDRHPGEVRREGEVHVPGRELHRVDRSERQARRDGAEGRDRLRQPRQLGGDEGGCDPAPGCVLEVGGELVEVQSADGAEDRGRRQYEQRGLDRRPPGDASQPDEWGRLDADGLGGLTAQLVRLDLGGVERLAERGSERGRLEVGQQHGDVLCSDRPDRHGDRPLRSGERGGRGEQLGAVGEELVGAGCHRAAGEVDDAHGAVLADAKRVRVDPGVRDAGGAEPFDRLPRPPEQLVVDLAPVRAPRPGANRPEARSAHHPTTTLRRSRPARSGRPPDARGA